MSGPISGRFPPLPNPVFSAPGRVFFQFFCVSGRVFCHFSGTRFGAHFWYPKWGPSKQSKWRYPKWGTKNEPQNGDQKNWIFRARKKHHKARQVGGLGGSGRGTFSINRRLLAGRFCPATWTRPPCLQSPLGSFRVWSCLDLSAKAAKAAYKR